jgi:uroporphyrin-III C-methyltransferase/precorrin-2 dehydrogenase/sirohydrochlorin ferrochelatase/uroporphyrin-III C-methyltransferase
MNQPNNHINPAFPTPGKVIFIGAGPGDPELLTIKALRWLQRADVIITDRLVSPEILTQYTTPAAQIIAVGKQGHSDVSTPQSRINGLLVEHASAGRLVIRLKGGDISIFSNILDELRALAANGISYELVPGITAALGAAAYAGIPLTARGYSTAVRFLTAYRNDLLDDPYWNDLAQTTDTLVFYMSSEPVDELVGRLLENNVPEDRWITIIEQATTPSQQVTNYPIREYLVAAAGRSWQSPSLVIIGKVGALDFAWLPAMTSTSPYFPAITPEKSKPATPATSKKTSLC